MAEVLVAPPVESLLVSYLSAALTARGDDAWVATRVPNPRPDRLVRVRRAGGPRTALVVDTATVVVECWDTDGVAAENLGGLLVGLLCAMDGETINGHLVLHAEVLGGPANDPDPDTTTPRYTISALLRLRAVAA